MKRVILTAVCLLMMAAIPLTAVIGKENDGETAARATESFTGDIPSAAPETAPAEKEKSSKAEENSESKAEVSHDNKAEENSDNKAGVSHDNKVMTIRQR